MAETKAKVVHYTDIPAGLLHQYVNAGDSPLKFLCGIPVKKLREQS